MNPCLHMVLKRPTCRMGHPPGASRTDANGCIMVSIFRIGRIQVCRAKRPAVASSPRTALNGARKDDPSAPASTPWLAAVNDASRLRAAPAGILGRDKEAWTEAESNVSS